MYQLLFLGSEDRAVTGQEKYLPSRRLQSREGERPYTNRLYNILLVSDKCHEQLLIFYKCFANEGVLQELPLGPSCYNRPYPLRQGAQCEDSSSY